MDFLVVFIKFWSNLCLGQLFQEDIGKAIFKKSSSCANNMVHTDLIGLSIALWQMAVSLEKCHFGSHPILNLMLKS